MFADTVYINGRIYTMECEGEATEAFAVRDHKILAVGATEEISSIACNKIVDLKGRTVLPGFIDAHLHLLAYELWLRLNRSRRSLTLHIRAEEM